MNATGFTLCYDLMELVGKSVVERRKELKRIAREKQATLTYWIHHSSDENIVEWLKRKDGRSAGDRQFDRVCCLLSTLPQRHRLLDAIAETNRAEDRGDDLWSLINVPYEVRQGSDRMMGGVW